MKSVTLTTKEVTTNDSVTYGLCVGCGVLRRPVYFLLLRHEGDDVMKDSALSDEKRQCCADVLNYTMHRMNAVNLTETEQVRVSVSNNPDLTVSELLEYWISQVMEKM